MARDEKFYDSRLEALRSIEQGRWTHITDKAQRKALAAYPPTNAEWAAASQFDGTNRSFAKFRAGSDPGSGTGPSPCLKRSDQ